MTEVQEQTIDPIIENTKQIRYDFQSHVDENTKWIEQLNAESKEKLEEVDFKVENLIKETNKEVDIGGIGKNAGTGGGDGNSEAIAGIVKKI